MNDYISELKKYETRLNPVRPYFNEQEYKRKRHEFFLKHFLLEKEHREQQHEQHQDVSPDSIGSDGGKPRENAISSPSIPDNEIIAPSNLILTALSPTSVELNWDDNSNNETAFVVERKYESNDWEVINGSLVENTTTYTDNNCLPNSNYQYRVSALNLQDYKTSNTATILTPLEVPSLTSDTNVSPIEITSNYPSGAESIYFEYSDDNNTWVELSTISSPISTIVDGTIPEDSIRYYKARALKITSPTNQSEFSSPITVSSLSASLIGIYTLDSDQRTSLGIYNDNDILVRTLWGGKDDTRGRHMFTWDYLNDLGIPVEDGSYTAKLLTNAVEYNWEGVIGNTSIPLNNYVGTTDKHRTFHFIWDMDYNDAGYGIYCNDYNEGQGLGYSFDTDNYQRIDFSKSFNANFLFKISKICVDDTHVYYAVNKGAGTESCLNRREIDSWSINSVGWPISSYGLSSDKAFLDKGINLGTENCTGLAIEKSTDLLAASYQSLSSIKIYNRKTGEPLSAVNSISEPTDCDFDSSGNLYVISKTDKSVYKIDTSNSYTITKVLTGFDAPVSLATDQVNGLMAISDAGDSQIVKAYNLSAYELQWTIGLSGGHITNGPDVTNTKFLFWDFGYGFERSALMFHPIDNTLWVGDIGNNRMQIFNVDDQSYSDTIMWQPHSYVSSVNMNDSTRVFSNWHEFSVNYSQPLSSGWTLTKNWAAGGDLSNLTGRKRGIHRMTTVNLSGTDYDIVVANNGNDQYIGTLTSNGIVYTTHKLANYESIYKNGELRYIPNQRAIDGVQTIYEKQLIGLSSTDYIWSNAISAASYPAISSTPYYNGHFSGYTAYIFDETDNNEFILLQSNKYSELGFQKLHLGLVDRDSTNWKLLTSKGGLAWSKESVPFGDPAGVDTKNGSFDDVSTWQYGGNRVATQDNYIMYGFHGEFWGGGQANQWLHFNPDGLFINNFGIFSNPYLNPSQTQPGCSGNSFSWSYVKNNGEHYVYVNDESVHSGVHRWHLYNLSSVEMNNIPLSTTLPDAPAAPSGLSAVATEPYVVELNWINNADNEFLFRIERSGLSANDWSDVGITIDTNYTDTTVVENSAYDYRVRAENPGGVSDYTYKYNVATPSADLKLMDNFANVVSGYSVYRYLRAAYTGPVIKLRRTSDNAESDFTLSEVTDGTLSAWSASTDAYVVTYYDHSSNAKHVTQSDTARQPKFITNGVVDSDGLYFDGTDRLDSSSEIVPSTVSIYSVAKCAATGNFNRGPFDWANVTIYQQDTTWRFAPSGATVTGDVAQHSIVTFRCQDGQQQMTYNDTGSNSGTSSFTPETNVLRIGQGSLSLHIGHIKEIIIFEDYKSDVDNTAIRDDINTIHSIF